MLLETEIAPLLKVLKWADKTECSLLYITKENEVYLFYDDKNTIRFKFPLIAKRNIALLPVGYKNTMRFISKERAKQQKNDFNKMLFSLDEGIVGVGIDPNEIKKLTIQKGISNFESKTTMLFNQRVANSKANPVSKLLIKKEILVNFLKDLHIGDENTVVFRVMKGYLRVELWQRKRTFVRTKSMNIEYGYIPVKHTQDETFIVKGSAIKFIIEDKQLLGDMEFHISNGLDGVVVNYELPNFETTFFLPYENVFQNNRLL